VLQNIPNEPPSDVIVEDVSLVADKLFILSSQICNCCSTNCGGFPKCLRSINDKRPHLNVPDTFVVPETTSVAHLIPSELSLVITDVDNLSAWRYEIFAFAAFKLPIVA
jgi:hypothetical protein